MPQHRRFFDIAGITIQVDSDLPIDDGTFSERFGSFAVAGPGADLVNQRHHFEVPSLDDQDLGVEVYKRPPWRIFDCGDKWLYEGITAGEPDKPPYRLAWFDREHAHGELFNDEARAEWWRRGGVTSLTMFPSDQILLARLLADRQGCILHSSAVTIDGIGLQFVGHAGAGKSTTVEMLRAKLGDRVEILCDDRNIVRRGATGFRVYGTWSHGDVPDVSSGSAPLRAILFLHQASRNELVPLSLPGTAWNMLLATLIKPLVTAEWWEKEMAVLEQIVAEVPCYTMSFDASGDIVEKLERMFL